MKIAIPRWQERVSPLFDEAVRFSIIEISDEKETGRSEISFPSAEPLERITFLSHLGVETVICGAISQILYSSFESLNIRVIPHKCGGVDDIIRAFLRGRLNDSRYILPGYGNPEPD